MLKADLIAKADLVHNEKINAESLIGIAHLDRDEIFDTIVREYSADVALLANRLLSWPGDVDDIVQDVFLAAFTGLKKFRRDCDIKTWLFTITINKCRTYKYKKMLSLKFFEKFSSGLTAESTSGVSEKQIKDETFERVRKAVSALPVKYRQAVVLKYLQEMETADITKILKISENTLNVRLSRAKKILNKKLSALMEE